jgi:hypothetical protein
MGPDVAPVFRVCYWLLANRAVGIAAFMVTSKVWVNSQMACSTLFQGSVII